MKKTSLEKPSVRKIAKKVVSKPKPGSYEAMLLAIEIAKSTGVKATWVKQ